MFIFQISKKELYSYRGCRGIRYLQRQVSTFLRGQHWFQLHSFQLLQLHSFQLLQPGFRRQFPVQLLPFQLLHQFRFQLQLLHLQLWVVNGLLYPKITSKVSSDLAEGTSNEAESSNDEEKETHGWLGSLSARCPFILSGRQTRSFYVRGFHLPGEENEVQNNLKKTRGRPWSECSLFFWNFTVIPPN